MTRVRRAETGNDQDPQPTHPVQSLITFFLCGWFITGCVWVYRIYWPRTEPNSPTDLNYCNSVVYLFSFWLITTAYIFLGLFTSCICCFSIVSVLLKRDCWSLRDKRDLLTWPWTLGTGAMAWDRFHRIGPLFDWTGPNSGHLPKVFCKKIQIWQYF